MRIQSLCAGLTLAATSVLGTGTALADREEESERGCAGAEETCESYEGSPRFEESPVNIGPICIQDGACRFESEPESDPAEEEAPTEE